MSVEQRKWIDEASYEELLRRWRFAPSEDLIFHGDIGEYYAEEMRKKRVAIGEIERTRISQAIGWKEDGG